MKILVIIPTYNEAQKIYSVVQSVISRGYDVLVIDDGSYDTTSKEVHRTGAVVLRHYINRGYGAALETGNIWALKNDYDVIVHFDGDGQHNPDEIKNLVNPIIREKADVVIGSRFIGDTESMPIIRHMLIRLAILFTWVFSGIKLTDAHNGFRAFSSESLNKIKCKQDGMSYASEVIDQIAEHRLRVYEIPVTIKYTDYSKSKGQGNIKKVLVGIRFVWGKLIK